MQVVDYNMLLNRYVMARHTISQTRLNELWLPMPMSIGYLYASSFMVLALGLLYAPIYPPAYLVTAIGLVFLYWTTQYAIAFNYRRPRQVDIGMLAQERRMLCYGVVLAHILIMILGTNAAAPQSKLGVAMIGPGISLFIWLLFCCLESTSSFFVPGLGTVSPWDKCPGHEQFKKFVHEEADAAFAEEDTQGIRYADVPEAKGYSVARYVCPVPVAHVGDWNAQSDADCLGLAVESSVFAMKWNKVIRRAPSQRPLHRSLHCPSHC